MEFDLKPAFFHDFNKYRLCSPMTFNKMLRMYLCFSLPEKEQARLDLIERYWHKLPVKIQQEREALLDAGRKNGDELLRQEITKRDYLLSAVLKDDSWQGGLLTVPFKLRKYGFGV